MRSKIKPAGQTTPSFIETARRAQIIEQAIETIARLGYAQASLAQIAKRAGISKGVITYYFASKEELLKQVAIDIFSAAAQNISPQVAAQPSAALRLQAYIRSALEYIGAHRTRMVALIEILTHDRGAGAIPIFDQALQASILADLEALLRKGQEEGDFRAFDLQVMAVTIRRAMDAVPHLYAANPNLDVTAYARELSTLFDRATRKE
jgi:TetR/AcrR family transcriptional regulator, fatty acid metabolism regulator protein